MHETDIVIHGAREHNLQNVSLVLPRNQLIAMTGVSGSGKSSLAFDTLYAEGQRRYVESLSSYARQFLGQMPKPEVDSITGLAPSISIQQKTSGRNPRSTVGTVTEIYDYLRVLYARVGDGNCASCGQPITAQSAEQILESLLLMPDGTRYLILAPVVQRQKGEYRDLFQELLKRGYLRARVDGAIVALSDNLQLDRQMRHTIDVVIDRLEAGPNIRSRLAEAVEQALKMGTGSLIVATEEEKRATIEFDDDESSKMPAANSETGASESVLVDRLYSSRYACTTCQTSYESPSPQLFSFNSPQGMCMECTGLGVRHEFDLKLLIPDEEKSIEDGAIVLLGPFSKMGKWRKHIYWGVANYLEKKNKMKLDSLLRTPWKKLAEPLKHAMLFGTGDRHITFSWIGRDGLEKTGGKYDGIVTELMDAYRKSKSPMKRKQLERFLHLSTCSACGGSRLNAQARSVRLTSLSYSPDTESLPVVLAPSRRSPVESTKAKKVTLKATKKAKTKVVEQPEAIAPPILPATPVVEALPQGPVSKSLPEVCRLTISEAIRFFENLHLNELQQKIAKEAIREIQGRLGFLVRCGLDYLTLDRTAPTLSGGESQRIRLASQIGCGLVGVVYILDEPSIGLHPRDNDMLLNSLLDLRDQGNTVIVVEHDEDTMRAADHIVDFGPGPGVRGGKVVGEGTLAEILDNPRSVTGRFLSGKEQINPKKKRKDNSNVLTLRGVCHNNLKNVDIEIPLGRFVCITGVSGSGKSSLVTDVLWQILNRDLNRGEGIPGDYREIQGLEFLDKAIDIDQSPIGRTPRSNPATYTKLFDEIRDLYAMLPESKARGWKAGRFSFNVELGRCDACEGNGSNKLEMEFLADVWVTCPVCNGNRFKHDTLDVRFKGKTIAEVLDMDVEEALTHFSQVSHIAKLLQTLHDVGLDYIKLGQPSPTLSGGEAQRVKLAKELGKRSTGRTIYLLDEPTTGLHFADVKKLMEVLHGLVDLGNTVLVVEHNLDVIKTADWVIDMGPEGGAAGGRVVAEGTPEEIASNPMSHTGKALARQFGIGAGNKTQSATLSSAKRHRSESYFDPSRPISVSGAAQHNLQKIDLTIPRHEMSVFCGPSGSGKTSMAMDTLYAEGQRRYVESLSSYARQFLGQMPKPRFENITGLSPAVAIEQKTVSNSPRSTVGTVTEIYDYLRVLYARLGKSYCPKCDVPVETQTTDQVIEQLIDRESGTRLILLAPVEVNSNTEFSEYFARLATEGYRRVRVNGVTHTIEEIPELDHRRKHQIEIVVDRVTIGSGLRKRFAESIELALDLGKGVMKVAEPREGVQEPDWPVETFSLHRSCSSCGEGFDALTPSQFSFNSALGWCPACEGHGVTRGTALSAIVPDERLSLWDGAIATWPDPKTNTLFGRILGAFGKQLAIPLDISYHQLDSRQKRFVLFGAGERWFEIPPDTQTKQPGFRMQYKGIYPVLSDVGRLSPTLYHRVNKVVGDVPCPTCIGSRLRSDAAAVRVANRTLQQLCELPLNQAHELLTKMKLSARDKKIAGELLREAASRISFLVDVGLHYLTLARGMPTLSGGESQRIRLAGQVGRSLTGVLYVLDEPTIGLHPRDNGRLLSALRSLRDIGNTVILVEHDKEVLLAADRIYDFGPGAGRFGGRITAEGSPAEVLKQSASLTGKYLSDTEQIPIPLQRRMEPNSHGNKNAPPGGGWLDIKGASFHNLKNVSVSIPLGALVCVTGVSGSGKSSLILDTLAAMVHGNFYGFYEVEQLCESLEGTHRVNKLIRVDQQPLGATPASNPATYTGVFDLIRDLFTNLPDAKVRGYRSGRFSFNRPGGRCESCEGNGQKKIEMHFLADVWVTCEECQGRRFNSETLAITYHGKSISDVLEMSIGDALKLFSNIPKIRTILATLCAVGLDYLTLGQSAATLSGGEAQRVKLAAELARPDTGRTLYVLDEPTTGLHFDDIRKLLTVLHSLVEKKNTVIVIEHNLDVIKTADWIIDMGPEAGIEGGMVVAEGTPEEIIDPKNWKHHSYTGELLAPLVKTGRRERYEIFDIKEAARAKQGDIDIDQVGKTVLMPWKSDGRRWHLETRLDHNALPLKWEVDALTLVTDMIESHGGFRVDWNERSVIECSPIIPSYQWFCHLLTGEPWFLTIKVRVPSRTFKERELTRAIKLVPFSEIDEIPVYHPEPRVQLRQIQSDWEEVAITVHWHHEIDTQEFRDFLTDAMAEFIDCGGKPRMPLPFIEITPWGKLGRDWHVSERGFPARMTREWEISVLSALFKALEEKLPGIKFNWNNRDAVTAVVGPNIRFLIQTKNPEHIELQIGLPRDTLNQVQVAEVSLNHVYRQTMKEGQTVTMTLIKIEDIESGIGSVLKCVPNSIINPK